MYCDALLCFDNGRVIHYRDKFCLFSLTFQIGLKVLTRDPLWRLYKPMKRFFVHGSNPRADIFRFIPELSDRFLFGRLVKRFEVRNILERGS